MMNTIIATFQEQIEELKTNIKNKEAIVAQQNDSIDKLQKDMGKELGRDEAAE